MIKTAERTIARLSTAYILGYGKGRVAYFLNRFIRETVMAEDRIERACTVPPKGWWCSREAGHEGPCAARQTHPLDTCKCGDYRRDHPGDGPCNFNSDDSRGANGSASHGFQPCLGFRLETDHG